MQSKLFKITSKTQTQYKAKVCSSPEARGGGQEEQPHAPGQERWPGGPTPRPGSPGCTGAGGPRGAIPH